MNTAAGQGEITTEANPDEFTMQVEGASHLHGEAAATCIRDRQDVAERLFRRSLDLFEQSECINLPDVAVMLGGLGAAYEAHCDYASAEECYRRAARIADGIADEGDEGLAQMRLESMSNLGRILRIQGRYTQADPFIRWALSFARQRFGADSLQAAWAVYALGMLGKVAGWFDIAEVCYRRSLAILEKRLGPDCAEAELIYHNLAAIYQARGDLVRAEETYKRAMSMKEKICNS